MLGVIQARLASKRLPEKVLLPLGTSTVLNKIASRLKAAKSVSKVVVACPEDDCERITRETLLKCIGGPEEDLVTRLLTAAEGHDRFVRVTADCPLVDPFLIDAMAKYQDYPVICNTVTRQYPNGMDLEIYDTEWFEEVGEEIPEEDREYFLPWILKNKRREVLDFCCPENLSGYRVTLDYPEDYEVIKAIYKAQGDGIWDTSKVVGYMTLFPKLGALVEKYKKETGGKDEGRSVWRPGDNQ